jgi:hypothetical protein
MIVCMGKIGVVICYNAKSKQKCKKKREEENTECDMDASGDGIWQFESGTRDSESFSDMGWFIQVEGVVYRGVIERLIGKLTRVYNGSGN